VVGYNNDQAEKIVQKALEGLRDLDIKSAVDGNGEEVVADDSENYSAPPAAAPVKQGADLGPSAQPSSRMSAEPTTPISSPSGAGITAENAPAAEAQPTLTLVPGSDPPSQIPAIDTAVETTEDRPSLTHDTSSLQGRSWQTLTVEEATHALSRTPPTHPHHAANVFILGQLYLLRYNSTKDHTFLTLALKHTESSLRLFPGILRLIPLVSICRILSLQGSYTRADLLLNEGLAIEIEGAGVSTLMSSSRLRGERYSTTHEAEHLEMAITYMTEELATQSGEGRGSLLLTLSCMHNYSFMATREAADLDMAIDHLTELTGLSANPKLRRMLARYHATRYETSKALTDLDAAAAALEAALYAAKGGSAARADTILRAAVARHRWLNTDLGADVRDALKWLYIMALTFRPYAMLVVELEFPSIKALLLAHTRIIGDRESLVELKHFASKLFDQLPEGDERNKMAVELANLESKLADGYGMDPIAHVEAGLDVIDPEEEPELYIDRLDILSNHLMARFERYGNPADVTAAAEKLEIVVAVTKPVGWRYFDRLQRSSRCLYIRHRALGEPADLDSAVAYGEMCLAAAEALPGDDGSHHHIRASHFFLIIAYTARFNQTDQVSDLDKARKLATVASEGIEEGDPLYASSLANLALNYGKMFERSSVKMHIDSAIEIGQRALEMAFKCKLDREHQATHMERLSRFYLLRYLRKPIASDEDLVDGIRHSEEALKRTPMDHPGYADRLMLLGRWAHWKHMRKHGSLEDMDRGIKYVKTALDMMPSGSPKQADARSTLALMQVMRRALGDPTDKVLVDADTQAWLEGSDGSIEGVLSAQYWLRYQRLGDLTDIEKAVEYSHAALLKSPERDATRGTALAVLAGHLMSRYERLGAMDDLDMAISKAREAVECTPVDAHGRHDRLIELCQLLIDRYRRIGYAAFDDLLAAITLGQRCVEVTDGSDPPVHLQIMLADALHLRHTIYPILFHDLERAIILTQNARALMGQMCSRNVHPIDIVHRLGKLFRSRFRYTGLVHDIDTAIEHLKTTVRECYDDEPSRGKVLDDLGRCYLLRYQAKQNTGPDGQLSFHSFRDAWNVTSAAPLVRIRAAQMVGNVYARSGKWTDAAAVYEACVNLMPRVSLPFLPRVDQQRLLAMLTGVASQAATCALLARKGAIHALKLLELGRGIIAGFVIDCRSDVTDLESEHPELWRQFTGLRRQMEDGLATPLRATGWELLGPKSVMAWRKKVMAKMEEVLGTIRGLLGYEGFLRPPSADSLMALAVSGPIVVVNANAPRCDAIMVTSTAITSIALDRWEWKEAHQQLGGMKDLVTGGMSTYAVRTKKMQELLIWLWDVVVSPVLTELGITAPPPQGGELPHIWWIGTGQLGLAPFHAAGHHKDGSTENAISRVISSYTPNIKALQYSRQKPAEPMRDLLLVTMPTTEGKSELEGVTEEVKRIIEIVQPDVATDLMVHPEVPEVLSSLGNYQVVHFACHGVINAEDPSSGGLLLQGGRLTVADVAAKSGCAMVAYLSACSTAETGDSVLVDEGITLAAAFQMAGFRHVVATMWEGRDEVCVGVAEGFYENIMKGFGVAKALHDAVVKARGEGRRAAKVLNWAPFIHNGA
jgi:hypothetical protein